MFDLQLVCRGKRNVVVMFYFAKTFIFYILWPLVGMHNDTVYKANQEMSTYSRVSTAAFVILVQS